jgi:PEP-CTERM motif
MKKTHLAMAALIGLMAAMAGQARATTVSINFSGPGVGGTLLLTYGTATDAKYANAFEATGISGTFSDSNNGLNIVNAPVGPLVAITHSTPEPTNLLAPNDFSRFAVASGLPAVNNGFLTYDNLFWPGGSPQTASDYPVSGGFLDIYGLMFNIGGGDVVDFWSNGISTGDTADYGVAVATAALSLDYVGGGVSASLPEPGSLSLFATGLIGLLSWRRRAASAIPTAAYPTSRPGC